MNFDPSHSSRQSVRSYFAPRLKLSAKPVALSLAMRLCTAVLLVSLAALCKLHLNSVLHGHAPFLLFFGAVVLSTWFGDLGAGLLSVFLSTVFSLLFSNNFDFSATAQSTSRPTALFVFETLIFVFESGFVVLTIHMMRRAQSLSAARATALQANEDRYRRVLDTAFEGIWIVDAQGCVTYCNEHLSLLLDYSFEEMLGLPLFEFVPLAERSIAVERFRERSGGARAQYEARLMRKDGVLIWFLVSSTPLLDENGQFQGSIAMLADISERKRIEQVLQQSEERYRAFVQQSSEAIWRFEMDEPLDCSLTPNAQVEHLLAHIYVAECNDAMAQMFDRKDADAMHNARLNEILPFTEANIDRLRTFVMNGCQLKNLVSQIDDAQGCAHFYETNLIGIKEDGYLRRIWGMRRDVTAQREAEKQRAVLLDREHEARLAAEQAHQELQSASRAKDEFLATLSHELRTPLNAIVGWSQLLLTEEMDGETTQYALSAIDRNAKLQAQLIEDLLDISCITMGRLQIEKQQVVIDEVLQAAIQTVLPTAYERGIAIEYSNRCEPQLMVCGDAQRLQQVAWNLLSNSIKFTPKDGKIRVILSSDGRHVKIEFADSGTGIAAEFLPFIFEAFRQADSSSTRSHGGVGLGLSIVKTLVDLHGGTIEAHSDGAGSGATFVVELPVDSTKDDASISINEP